MWIQHKAKEGDTLDSIAKQYKNKDPKAILQYPGNSKVAARLKKGEELSKGEVVWVLDPKGKVYIVKKNGKDVVLTEKEYKDFQKKVDAKMLAVVRRHESKYGSAADRHNAQLAINNDQWIVAGVLGIVSSVPEPEWKPALAALKKVQAAYSKSDYKGFGAAAEKAEKVITAYENGVINWVNGLISAGEGTVTVLTHVKDAGMFCGTLAAVTIAAPATLGAAVAVGAASSAGVGLLYDGAENGSLAYNGMKTMSASEIGKRFLANAATGAAGAFIAGNLLKLIKGPLVNALMKNNVVKTQALRLATKVLPKKVFERELANVLSSIAKGGTIHVDKFMKMTNADRIALEAMVKFFTRFGNGLMMKKIGVNKKILAELESWVGTAPKELGGKDPKAAVDAATKKIASSSVADSLFDEILKENMKDFQKVLNEVITEHAKKLQKKAA
ncbi:MAG: hypothetical protein AB3N13_15720 [Arenibacterium sp.]